MTFQENTDVGEFCLLQSVIRPDSYSPDLYLAMVREGYGMQRRRVTDVDDHESQEQV